MERRVEKTVEVVNAAGLHARAAAELVRLTSRMPCDVMLEHDGQEVNGKSIMGVLLLAASQGSMVRVTVEGDGATDHLTAIVKLFEAGFYEL
jgi:phosphocarrier protein